MNAVTDVYTAVIALAHQQPDHGVVRRIRLVNMHDVGRVVYAPILRHVIVLHKILRLLVCHLVNCVLKVLREVLRKTLLN